MFKLLAYITATGILSALFFGLTLKMVFAWIIAVNVFYIGWLTLHYLEKDDD